MAKVTLAYSGALQPFNQWEHGALFLLRHSAEIDPFGAHQVTDDPEEADLILFVEMGSAGSFAERVRAHDSFRRYRHKCFLFDQGDFIFPLLPGIYAGLRKDHYRADHARTGFYLELGQNALIEHFKGPCKEKYLASFVGSKGTHAVREQLFLLERPDFYLYDTTAVSGRIRYHGDAQERLEFWRHYADSLAEAKFSLCPRGKAPNSIRLYESMKAGRACVIISDDWVPNDGIDWSACSLRVPESEVGRLPEILKANEHRATEMGENARREWEKWLSPPVLFHRVVEQCLEIERMRKGYRAAKFYSNYRYIPLHFRWYLTSKANLYRNYKKIYW